MKQFVGEHLDEDAMLRWQMEDASEAEREHLADCTVCLVKAKSLKDALGWFGTAAREWGGEKATMARARNDAKDAATLKWRKPKSALLLSWQSMVGVGAMVAAALLLIFGIGLPHRRSQQVPAPTTAMVQQAGEKQQITDNNALSDNALLEEVDQDVSQEVPAALQPLNWSTASRQ